MPRIFISTAEVSAELLASRVVEAFLREHPDADVNAAGGDVLVRAGARLAVDMTGRAVMGFWEALSQLGFYKRAEEAIIACLAENPHDALVLVDAPSFHLHLAGKVRKRWPELPILYYIAPKLWAWKEWRVKNLRRDISRTLCIFPFEVRFFQDRGVDAVFVGNPTLDQVRLVDNRKMTQVLNVHEVRRHSEPSRGVLAVFPGSRTQEIRHIWPVMVKTIEILRGRFPELKIAVALAPGWSRERLAEYAPLPDGAAFIHGESQALLASASAALVKSGTTTLEAALLGVPMAVCYLGNAVNYRIAKVFVKLPYVSLPNILAGKGLVREYIQHEATPENLADELTRILSDRRYYRQMRSKLRDLRRSLGEEFAAERAAREIASFAVGKGN